MDHVDVEGGAGGRMVVPGRVEVRLDPPGSHIVQIPAHLWLKGYTCYHPILQRERAFGDFTV